MDSATRKILEGLDHQNLDAVEISGRQWKKFPFKSYRNFKYPEFDITNVSADHDDSCDIIIAEQVFEHVRLPFRGCENVCRMLRSGGYFLITTPFFLRVHGAPMDYWRWTPAGLIAMLEDCGFDVLESGSWGNRDCVIANLDRWEDYTDQSLDDDPDLPMMVWALARKKDA